MSERFHQAPTRISCASLKCRYGLAAARPWTYAARAAYFGEPVCPFCDHRNPAGAKFCSDCGSPLHLKPCNQCDAVNSQAATNCYKCGAECPALFTTPEAAPVLPAADPTPAWPTPGDVGVSATVTQPLLAAAALRTGWRLAVHRDDHDRGRLCRVPHPCGDARRDGESPRNRSMPVSTTHPQAASAVPMAVESSLWNPRQLPPSKRPFPLPTPRHRSAQARVNARRLFPPQSAQARVKPRPLFPPQSAQARVKPRACSATSAQARVKPRRLFRHKARKRASNPGCLSCRHR